MGSSPQVRLCRTLNMPNVLRELRDDVTLIHFPYC
jgi:hypothetical protein